MNNHVYSFRSRAAKAFCKIGTQLLIAMAVSNGLAIGSLAQTNSDATYSPIHRGPDTGDGRNGRDPLSVRNGVLLKDGAPYRAIGFNYYDAFNRFLLNGDTSYRAGFQQLAAAGIPFIRFQVLPFWPRDARTYVDNPQALYTALDTFVADAASYHIGLVPTIFWNFSTVPDIKGEPVSAWGNFASKTRAFSDSFAQQLAARYADSPTIWIWEMSNEVNDWSDTSFGYKAWPISTAYGTPATRTPADNYTSAQLLSAYSGFAGAIHTGDPTRLASSGYDVPRNNAFNLSRNGSYTQDTVSQFYSVVATQYQPGDVVSMHVYPVSFFNRNLLRFGDMPVTAEQFLPVAQAASTAVLKPLFIGEYGVSDDGSAPYSTPELSFSEFQSMTAAIVATLSSGPACSGLAAPWVYDFSFQNGMHGNYDITATNAHANRLTVVSEANRQLQQSPCHGDH